MGEPKEKLVKAIIHYQDSLERHTKTGNSDKLLHAIDKLGKLPIRVCHLEETGVGRTVNGLKKFEGSVGENARTLVDKWKSMVKGEEDQEEQKLIQEQQVVTIKNEIVDEKPDPDPDSLQIENQEGSGSDRAKHIEISDSSHGKSNSSNKISQSNSRHSDPYKSNKSRDRHEKKTKRGPPSEDSDSNNSSASEYRSKKHKSDKPEKISKHSSSSRKYGDTDSESDESGSSRESSPRRTKDKKKSGRSSSESSERSSSNSDQSSHEGSSSDTDDKESRSFKNYSNSYKKYNKSRSGPSESDSDAKSRHNHHKSKDKSNNSKKSSSGSDRDRKVNSKPKDRHHDSKHRSSKSKDKSGDSHSKSDHSKANKYERGRDSSSKEHSSNKTTKSKSSETEFSNSNKVDSYKKGKSRADSDRDSKKSSSKTEDKKKDDSRTDNSKSKREKENTKSNDKKRSIEASADRHSKRKKDDSGECKASKDKKHEHSSSSKSDIKKEGDSKKEKDRKSKPETINNKKDSNNSSSKTPKEKDKLITPGSSKVKKATKKLLDGIDSGSGTSFADVLGMLATPVYSKGKKKSTGSEEKQSIETIASSSKEEKTFKNRSGTEESRSIKENEEVPNLLVNGGNLEPLDINITSLLPSITPNYRPLSTPSDNYNKKICTDDEALTRVITAKHQRTKVYSGNKSTYTKVPTLFEICSRILQDNLDALEYTGGVPYSILKHILEKANPDQLYQLEFHNPYLIEDSDELWHLHCQKEFRNKKREELESWREMYMRCLDEREAKLKALTNNIKQSQDKSIPVRQTKLAYVDSVVKPPRNIARKQARNGTAVDIKRPMKTPAERRAELAKAGESAKVAVPNPGRAPVDRGGISASHNYHPKPKKAPLMAKTLSLLKNRFGRR